MKILKIIGFFLAGIVLIAVLYGSMQPSKGEMDRSIIINTGPELIYSEISNFKNFNNWSPWFTIDPETKYDYEGPETGVGAKMSWISDHPDVGQGSQEILKAEENRKVTLALDFGFQGNYYSDMILEPVSEGTKVIWTYRYDDLNLISALFSGLFSAEKMVGESYEKGLNNLKAYVELKPAPEPEVMEEKMASDSTIVE
jgi:hypothetical protein